MNKRGFTLVELIVVIGIISLLSSIVLASLGNARAKARDARRLVDMHNIRTALELYKSKYGVYPGEDTVAGSTCGGYDAGYKDASDPGFIPGLVADGIFGKTPGDPLSDGCAEEGGGDHVYKYEYKENGMPALGCPKPFYILGIKNMETITGAHPSSPGFPECTGYSLAAFEWAIGSYE